MLLHVIVSVEWCEGIGDVKVLCKTCTKCTLMPGNMNHKHTDMTWLPSILFIEAEQKHCSDNLSQIFFFWLGQIVVETFSTGRWFCALSLRSSSLLILLFPQCPSSAWSCYDALVIVRVIIITILIIAEISWYMLQRSQQSVNQNNLFSDFSRFN